MSFSQNEKRTKRPKRNKDSREVGAAGQNPDHAGKKEKRRGSGEKTVNSQLRMSSITNRLLFLFLKKRAASILMTDLALAAGIAASWMAGMEYTALGGISPYVRRSLEKTEGIRTLLYVVTGKDGEQLMQAALWPAAAFFLGGLAILLAFQIVFCIVKLAGEHEQIRRILAPINEIALKADELSRFSFTEDKYHMIEDAIANVTPGEETRLDFGDSDLSGIEAAMNNLLKRMRDSYRQQARFVNDASHELRTPIAVIKGYADMLDRWGKTDEKILEESIAAIKNESGRMEHLVNQLLFLARGDSGSTRLTLEPVSPGRLMKEIYEESLLIDEHHIYRFNEDTPDCVIQADAGLLKQAVRILVDNAAKYTPEGSEIRLECGLAEDGDIYLQVQDTGIGMGEKDIAGMFERFYRSDEVRNYPGTGLGLSISKWIVDRHHGHFEVLSRTGLGTRIRIVLPGSRE